MTHLAPSPAPPVLLRAALAADTALEARAYLGLAPDAVPPRYRPELRVLLASDGAIRAAGLLSERPTTAARKLSRVRAVDESALTELVAAVAEEVLAQPGMVGLKWQHDDDAHRAVAERLGFSRMPAPLASGPGTEGAVGYVRWTRDYRRPAIPYYRQTTDFTCGPVSLMMAEAAGGGADASLERERRIWRRATRFTGCGPRGLSLEVDRERFELAVYDTEFVAPQLVPMEPKDARAYANEEDLVRMRAAGIRTVERAFGLDELALAIESGSLGLVLVDEGAFHGEPSVHWTVAHSYDDGIFLINDPWVSAEDGESWVDAVDVPLALESLDRMAWWGDPAYRSVLILTPR